MTINCNCDGSGWVEVVIAGHIDFVPCRCGKAEGEIKKRKPIRDVGELRDGDRGELLKDRFPVVTK